MEKRAKLIVYGLVALGLLIGAGSAARVYFMLSHSKTTTAGPSFGKDFKGDFSLTDHTGKAVSNKDYRGTFMLVFFGYTFCPDVCPTELQVISDVMDMLKERSAKVQPIFITVDPKRDTAEVMADYVGAFHLKLIGLTGNAEQIAAAAKSYGAAYYKVMMPSFEDADSPEGKKKTADPDYLVNHTAYTYLIGPDGQFLFRFPHGTDPKTMSDKVANYIKDLSS